MKAIIEIIRRLFSFIIFILLFLILTLTPTLLSISTLLTNRETLPRWIETSGIYQEASDLAFQKIKDEFKKEGINIKEVPIKDFEKSIKKAISPELVKTNVLAIINGTYDWLEGKTPNLEITTKGLDLQKIIKDTLPKNIVNELDFVKQLNLLKPCTEAQAIKYEKLGGFKSLEEICVPPTLNLINVVDDSYNKIDTDLEKKLVKLDNVFGIPPIDAKTSDTVFFYYKTLVYMPIILLCSVILLSVLYLLLEPSKQFKFYALGALLTIIGGISLFIFNSKWILLQINTIFEKTLFKEIGTEIDIQIIKNLQNTIITDVFKIASNYGIYILVGGIILVVVTIFISRTSSSKTK